MQLCYNTIVPNQFSHPWTSSELEYLKENIKKCTYKQMGEFLDRSPASIQSKIRFLPFQQKVKKYPFNTDFFKSWSDEMAYVLGFIAADGNICKTGRAHVLHIACDDKDIIEKIKKALRYEGIIHQKVRFNGKISYSLRICDIILFQDLQLLNITERKSLTVIPPAMPEKYLRHFIRGYFDGDGSVSLRNSQYPSRLIVDIYTASLGMATFLYEKIKPITEDTYTGKIRITLAHQKTKYYVIRLGHNAAMKLFSYMYTGTNFYLERKYKKFLEGLYGS